jgi:hypothetical protein
VTPVQKKPFRVRCERSGSRQRRRRRDDHAVPRTNSPSIDLVRSTPRITRGGSSPAPPRGRRRGPRHEVARPAASTAAWMLGSPARSASRRSAPAPARGCAKRLTRPRRPRPRRRPPSRRRPAPVKGRSRVDAFPLEAHRSRSAGGHREVPLRLLRTTPRRRDRVGVPACVDPSPVRRRARAPPAGRTRCRTSRRGRARDVRGLAGLRAAGDGREMRAASAVRSVWFQRRLHFARGAWTAPSVAQRAASSCGGGRAPGPQQRGGGARGRAEARGRGPYSSLSSSIAAFESRPGA